MSSTVGTFVKVGSLAGGLGLLALGLACTKKDDAGKPASIPALETPTAAPAAPPTPPPPAPPSPAPAAPGAPPDPAATITGQITIASALAKSKPPGTLYLVARRLADNPTARGTLIAVKKLPADKFPLDFTLSAADMPFQNGAFDGELTLSVRIDQDGDPMSRQKGDLFGGLPKVRVGSHDVKIALDQVQKEAESLGQPGPGMGGPIGPMGGAHLPPGHP
jgi:hypothetical protein